MAKITYSAVDRCDLEKTLLEKKEEKYVVLYPTYEIVCNKGNDEGVDYSTGSTFSVPVPNDDSGTCTNIFGVLAEVPCLPRYFALRAILANAGAYCRTKKIGLMIISAAMLNEVMDDNIDRDMLNAAIKETLAGISIEVVITPNVTDDDAKILSTLEDAKAHFEETRRAQKTFEEVEDNMRKKSKKAKKNKKGKKDKKGKKNKK